MIRIRTFSVRTGRGGPRLHPAALAGWGIGLACALAPVPVASQVGGTAPDTVVVNVANATYLSASGVRGTASATSTVKIHRVTGVGLEPPRDAAVFPGERRVLAHVLRNRGNGDDRFTLEAAGPAGWSLALHRDVNADGVLDATDPRITGAVALGAGEAADILLVVDVPADAPESEAEIEVRAASAVRPEVRASVVDRLAVRRPLAALRLAKAVDRVQAARGDTLTYTLSFANQGDAAAPDVVLADTLPTGARFVAGSLRLDGRGLSDPEDGDAGERLALQDGRELLRWRLGAVAPGASGAATFRAVVAPQAGDEPLSNLAVVSSGDIRLASPPAVTRLGTPELEVSKDRLGADTLRVGEEAVYRLRVRNRSQAFTARDVVLADTLPAGLAPVAAAGWELTGQVALWRIGTLAPGAEAQVELRARVVEGFDGPVVNRATVRALNAPAASAEATPLWARSFRGDELELVKGVGVLEAGLGEAVPYTLTLRNVGDVPLREVVIRDRLPDGVRLVEADVTGADSVRTRGQEATFYVAGPLAPGMEHRVRYAVVLLSAPRSGAPLANRATAEAEGARVRSATATAWVRVRRGRPVESRLLLGKVWTDRDGDGRQGPGEEGVGGVEVWSAEGEVVTTDGEGRFSFRDLRPGDHVLRIDTLSLPAGVRLAPGSATSARVVADGWTTPTLTFRVVPREGAAASDANEAEKRTVLGFTPAAVGAGVAPAPVVAALRTAAERKGDEDRAFIDGPTVRITAPGDGTVLPTNRLYVGLRGEAGAAARLFDGDSLIGEGELRPDGSFDFVNVDLAEGPHRLRAWMRSSWGRERWDSVSVHRSGPAARIEPLETGRLELRADSREPLQVGVRVLDAWDVPVATRPTVTVEVRGGVVAADDADPSSLGMQLAVGADGVLVVPLRGGETVGMGDLVLRSGDAELRLPLTVLPSARPLIATGTVQVGVGAAPEAFGAATVRGAIGERTAVSVTFDSRRGEDGDEFFGRDYDPQEEGRYPTLGDGSQRRTLGSATQAVSARVEHGLDWVEVGDVETSGFSGSERLGGYRRALTGAAARVGTGALVWRAFGSVTDQALVSEQLRADGGSGPYRFGGGVRPGTERIAVEVRARDNAARLVSRQELVRSVDYQIDYATGMVLLQRPVPAEDPYGNPVFVTALLERRSGGEQRFVGGARLEADAARLVPELGADSLGIALFGVHDGAGEPGGAAEGAGLAGAELHLRQGGVSATAEVFRSEHADSASLAGQAELRWTLPGERVRLEAGWLRVGDGFASSLNPRLGSGVEELRLGSEFRIGEHGRLRLRHERQEFHGYGVERRSTFLSAEERVAGRRVTAEAGVLSDIQGTQGESSVATGKAVLALSPRADLWLEGTQSLAAPAGVPGRPEVLGVGGAYRLLPGVRLEGSRRWMRLHGDSAEYSVSGINLRTDLGLGASVWSGLERTEAGGATHSAVLGWNQRLSLEGGWAVHSLLERRFGVERAPLADPVRALPFAQAEPDRWSAALGVDWLPQAGPRFSSRGELHGGALRSSWRWDLSADLPLGRSAALLTRHDWLHDERVLPLGRERSRWERSLVGFALRPVGSEALNALGKLEWRRAVNPLAGGVLTGSDEERRLIAATDAIWAPMPGVSVAGRYALRHTVAEDTASALAALRSTAHFTGGRVEGGYRRVRVRLDGRFLAEGVTRSTRWSAAPSLVVGLGGGLEAEGGYRFGNLQDPDFAAYGRSGFFALLGLRFTEGTVQDAAGFWRERIARDP